MKGKILNHLGATFLGIGYGLNIKAIMRRDGISANEASIKAAKSIIGACYHRILDHEEKVIDGEKSNSFNAGYFDS
jgi:hypothetical protein